MKTIKIWWSSMGWLKWPNLLLVVIALYLSTRSEMGYYSSPDWINLGRRYIDNIELNVYARGRIRPGQETPLLIETSDPINLLVGISGEKKFINITINGDGEEQFTLTTPNQTSKEIVIKIETDQGDSASWNLGRLYR